MFSFFKRSKSKSEAKKTKQLQQSPESPDGGTRNFSDEIISLTDGGTRQMKLQPSPKTTPKHKNVNSSASDGHGGDGACSSNLILYTTSDAAQIHVPMTQTHLAQSSSVSSLSTTEATFTADEVNEKVFNLNITLRTENNTLHSGVLNSQDDTTIECERKLKLLQSSTTPSNAETITAKSPATACEADTVREGHTRQVSVATSVTPSLTETFIAAVPPSAATTFPASETDTPKKSTATSHNFYNNFIMAKGRNKRNKNIKLKNNNSNNSSANNVNQNLNENENENSNELVKYNSVENKGIKQIQQEEERENNDHDNIQCKDDVLVRKQKNETDILFKDIVDENVVELVCTPNSSEENRKDKNKIRGRESVDAATAVTNIAATAAAGHGIREAADCEDDCDVNHRNCDDRKDDTLNGIEKYDSECTTAHTQANVVPVISTIFSPPASINDVQKYCNTKSDSVLVNTSSIITAANLTTTSATAATGENFEKAKFFNGGDFANTTTPALTTDATGGQHKSKIFSRESTASAINRQDICEKELLVEKKKNELLITENIIEKKMGQTQSTKKTNSSSIPKGANSHLNQNNTVISESGNSNASDDIFYEARNNDIDFIIDSITTQEIQSNGVQVPLVSNEDFELIDNIGSELNSETHQDSLINTQSYTICEHAFTDIDSTTAIAESSSTDIISSLMPHDRLKGVGEENGALVDEKHFKNESGVNLISLRKDSLAESATGVEEMCALSNVALETPSLSTTTMMSSATDEQISLPDVVESRCLIVLDPHILDKGKSPVTNIDSAVAVIGAKDQSSSEMKDVVNQEAHYAAKVDAAELQVLEAQAKTSELRFKIEELEREISERSWNNDRLQAELVCANKEGDGIRQKLRRQEGEMEILRMKITETEDLSMIKYEELEAKYIETQAKIKELQEIVTSLNLQLVAVEKEKRALITEKQKLEESRLEEQKLIRDALDAALMERSQSEAKWKNEFEQLRNVNSDREEHLMEDCEWKLRSMQKSCKEKLELAMKEKIVAVEKNEENRKTITEQNETISHLKTCESEVIVLRGLTTDQNQSIQTLSKQLNDLKSELESVNERLETEIKNVQKIKAQCQYDLHEKEREALNRIEIARGEMAMQWETRLIEEMSRLKMESEQMYAEERHAELAKLKREVDEETARLTEVFKNREQELTDEIESLKNTMEKRNNDLKEANNKADEQLVQSRMFVDRAQREHQQEVDKLVADRDKRIETMKNEFDQDKEEMEENFRTRLQQVKEEFGTEITDATENLKNKHKKEMEEQWKQLIADKEEALQKMESRHRLRMDEAENKMRELNTEHQRNMDELSDAHNFERNRLEKHDVQNVQEIDILHRKCRCLTKLFEEMRMRYERRDPRPEDLRQIDELKTIVDSQDRDIRLLTEKFREVQLTLQKEHPSTNLEFLKLPPEIQSHKLQTEIQSKTSNSDIKIMEPPMTVDPVAQSEKAQPPSPPQQQKQHQHNGPSPPSRKGKNRNKQHLNNNNTSNINQHFFHNSNQIINVNNTHNQTEQSQQHLSNHNVPTIQISTVIQSPPKTILRTNCDVIYEENETDLDTSAENDDVPSSILLYNDANICNEDDEQLNSSEKHHIKLFPTNINNGTPDAIPTA